MPLLAALCVSAFALPSLAQIDPQVEVLHSNLPGWPQSQVPGVSGLFFDQASAPFAQMAVSPSGHYGIIARVDSNPRKILLVNGRMMIRLDDPAPWALGETLDQMDNVSMNSTGELALSCATVGGPIAADAYLMTLMGEDWTQQFVEGDPVNGLPGVGHGRFFYNPTMLDNGDVAFTNDDLVGGGFGTDNAAFLSGSMVARVGVDIPTGQLGGGSSAWGFFNTRDGLRYDPTGTRWVSLGTLKSNSRVAVVDGAVVLQAGFPIPGSGSSSNVLLFDFAQMGADASWWVAGSNGTGRDHFLVRDGVVVAQTGQPIAPGSARVWTGNTAGHFAAAGSNIHGQYFVAGYADDNGLRSPVLVMNGTDVILESGDPIDVDGNGLYDDNVEFIGYESTGSYTGLDAFGRLMIVLRVYDLNTGEQGHAVARISPGAPFLTVNNLQGGQSADISIQLGTPGHTAIAAFSLDGAGPTSLPTPYGDVLLNLTPPWFQTAAQVVDAQGDASWSQGIPSFLSGEPVWAQAAVFDAFTLRVTNAVSATIQ